MCVASEGLPFSKHPLIMNIQVCLKNDKVQLLETDTSCVNTELIIQKNISVIKYYDSLIFNCLRSVGWSSATTTLNITCYWSRSRDQSRTNAKHGTLTWSWQITLGTVWWPASSEMKISSEVVDSTGRRAVGLKHPIPFFSSSSTQMLSEAITFIITIRAKVDGTRIKPPPPFQSKLWIHHLIQDFVQPPAISDCYRNFSMRKHKNFLYIFILPPPQFLLDVGKYL